MTVRLFGCTVTISPLFTGWVSLLLLIDTTGMMSRLLAAIVLHEAGHLLFLAWFDCRPRKVTLSLFEVNILARNRSLTSGQQLLVSVGGVLANGVAALLCTGTFRMANVYLAIFNSLPLFSMDGFQIAQLLCLSHPRLRLLPLVLSLATVSALAGVGVWLLVVGHNPMLLLFCLYIAALQIRPQRPTCKSRANGVS